METNPTLKTFWQLKQINPVGRNLSYGQIWYSYSEAKAALDKWSEENPLSQFELVPGKADLNLQRLHGVLN